MRNSERALCIIAGFVSFIFCGLAMYACSELEKAAGPFNAGAWVAAGFFVAMALQGCILLHKATGE